MSGIPVLFTTFNRLEYTKKSLPALLDSDCGWIYAFDNGSTDGTIEYLNDVAKDVKGLFVIDNKVNIGVAGAMNYFISIVRNQAAIVGKLDNDTIVPKDWITILLDKMNKYNIDIIQAKHQLMEATFAGANWDEWMKTMEQEPGDPSIHYHKFVGGSGILFRTAKVDTIPNHEWKLYGWNEFQKSHPELKKAFCDDVQIELLDMNKNGGSNYPAEYQNYYKETRRI